MMTVAIVKPKFREKVVKALGLNPESFPPDSPLVVRVQRLGKHIYPVSGTTALALERYVERPVYLA